MTRRVPYPLPAKKKRVRSGIERGPKRVWLRHRKFVRSHECCVPGCSAPAQFHHIRSAANSGTGLLPFDWFGVPLCEHHHHEHHDCGVDTFEDRHGVDLRAIAAELARRSPDIQMRLAMLEHDAPADPRPVIERVRMIDLAAGLPRFIPILGLVNDAARASPFPWTEHRSQAEVFEEEAEAKSKDCA